MKIDVGEMAAFASTESLAAREKRSGVEKAQNGTEERKKGKEGYGTSLNEQIPVETFSQRSGPDMKSYLPETGQKDISEVVSKCELIYMLNELFSFKGYQILPFTVTPVLSWPHIKRTLARVPSIRFIGVSLFHCWIDLIMI